MTENEPSILARTVRRYSAAPTSSVTECSDHLAHEEPLEIRVEGRSISVTMRTPGHDRELVAGFLLSEGIIQQPEDLFEISLCPSQSNQGNVIDVILRQPDHEKLAQLSRHVFANSSCGMCGRTSIDEIVTPSLSIAPEIGPRWTLPLLTALPEKLRAAQPAFLATGGMHGCALFDIAGNILAVREDVGRHNALDKLIGHAFFNRLLPAHPYLLLLSGRVSFELMQKSWLAGIPVVTAVGAPSSLAVDFATASGQSLIGFLSSGRCNIYAGFQRIRSADGKPLD
jgi:FdhD protein